MSFFQKFGDSLKFATRGVSKGKQAAIKSSEKMLRAERLKMEIRELREQKEQRMRDLAHRVYEYYTENNLTDPELLELCQQVKMLQWQIDEKWTEINHIKG